MRYKSQTATPFLCISYMFKFKSQGLLFQFEHKLTGIILI